MNVREFIEQNYREYLGDESFLKPISNKTSKLLERYNILIKEELAKGILDVELKEVSGINSFEPGYLDKENEVVFGLQTDKPLKRIINLYGGVKMAEKSLEAYGYHLDHELKETFSKYRKTHNDGVFDVYTEEVKKLRKHGVITGLPDAYGRGRIIGDYRRVALFGVDFLISEKEKEAKLIKIESEEAIRLKEEVKNQIKALGEIKEMALKYGFDISRKAENAQEAVQWLYFAYLSAVKENNGAATSLGRVSTFLDIYIEKDIEKGILSEEEAQELVDQFVLKLRMVRHLRTPEYDELFAGDPTWITESIGGMLENKSLVTKTSFRFLHTLINLGPSPEPNLTVLWSVNLPEKFKEYATKISIQTSSIQYENDDLMKPIYGHDYGISCCVSAMTIGEQMQYFGARCNLPKALLYSINAGIDEFDLEEVVKDIKPLTSEYLDYNEVMENYNKVLTKVASDYVDAMNIIHYMHDKYAYEASQMALHNTNVERLMAFGVAGLSVAADSLSAIKYAKVKVIRENGVAKDFLIEGDFPKYGNDNDLVDQIAVDLVKLFISKLRAKGLYRKARHTMSVLTITSNVVYGKMTGATPDGRKAKEAFAPGANPMHGRDRTGALASLNSVAKIPYKDVCDDGVSNTFSIVPTALGVEKEKNLVKIIDGYFTSGGHHLNTNVYSREMLIEAMENPELYPTLTIRVSGYAVHFNRLNKEQQLEVINRTFHEVIDCF